MIHIWPFWGSVCWLGSVTAQGNRTVPASKSKILVDAPKEAPKPNENFEPLCSVWTLWQGCRQDFFPILTFLGHRSSGALHLPEDLAVAPQTMQGNYKGSHPSTSFSGKTFSCALFRFFCALFRYFHKNLQSWKERDRDIELLQDAWLRLRTGMEIAPLISSGEAESATHPFNLIFNSKWVPELHCFQWGMKRVLVFFLNRKESSPESGH